MRWLNGGWTFIELLVTLMIVALLSCASIGLLQYVHVRHVRDDFVRHVAAVLQFSRVQAVLRHEVLVLEPLSTDRSWAMGARLLGYKTQHLIQEWHWHHAACVITWHGFQLADNILIDNDLIRLTMNGHFLMDCPYAASEKIRVTRLGRVH